MSSVNLDDGLRSSRLKPLVARKSTNVSFPMFSKISVKGSDIAPVYKWLIEKSGDPKDIEWNFGKFLVLKDGSTVKRFAPRDVPSSKTLEEAIISALAEK